MVDRTGKDVYDKQMRENQCQPDPPRTVEGRVAALSKSVDRLIDLIKRLSERYDCVMLPSNPSSCKESCGKPEVVSTVTCNLERELDRLYEASEELSGMIDRCNL